MNPKTVNDLDPKLKETYERVMGTSFGANPTPQAPAPTMQTQPVEEAPLLSSATEKNITDNVEPEVTQPSKIENSTVSQVFRADDSNKTVETATVNPPSKNAAAKMDFKKLMPLIIFGVVVFLVVYAVIWAKLLGLF
jgi:hypothetical protein